MGRAWLGGGGSAEGVERLVRVFRIGRAERALELENQLAELMARVRTLETELRALGRRDDPDPYQPETSGTSTVELRRPPEPGERDYELPIDAKALRSTPGRSGSASSKESCTGPAGIALTCSRSEPGASAGAIPAVRPRGGRRGDRTRRGRGDRPRGTSLIGESQPPGGRSRAATLAACPRLVTAHGQLVRPRVFPFAARG